MNQEKTRKAEKLSRELRGDSGAFLTQRRGIIGLSLVAVGSMSLITLYQMGMIKHMPEPPLSVFDADKVDASASAYAKLSTPDAAIGLGSYAMTIGLVAMGGKDRAYAQPWIPLTLAAKLGFDALQAGILTVDQVTKQKALCFWCLLAAGATFASVPLVIPEMYAALRQLLGKLQERQ